jgi:hypothetical protein
VKDRIREIVRKASSVNKAARADGTFGSRHQRVSFTCCAIFAIAISGGLSADSTQGLYQPPSNTQVIGYLLQSVNWYRHVYTERQVASDPGDLVFLNDNQAIESQIVELSFEFAKADVALAKTATSPHDAPTTLTGPAFADLAHFSELKNRNDQVTQQTSADIGKLNEKIASARKSRSQETKSRSRRCSEPIRTFAGCFAGGQRSSPVRTDCQDPASQHCNSRFDH